jgi:hypothetical protein
MINAIKYILCILLAGIVLADCTSSQNVQRSDKKINVNPFLMTITGGQPGDSFAYFIEEAFKKKGVRIITRDEMIQMVTDESNRIARILANRKEEIARNGFAKEFAKEHRYIFNLIGIKIKTSIKEEKVEIDSVQWSVFPMPMNSERLVSSKKMQIKVDRLAGLSMREKITALTDSILFSKELY